MVVRELASKKTGEIQCFSILTSPMQESLVRRPDLSKWSAGLAYNQRLGCIVHLQEYCKSMKAADRQSSQLSCRNRDGCNGHARYSPNGIYFPAYDLLGTSGSAAPNLTCASRKLTSLSCMG